MREALLPKQLVAHAGSTGTKNPKLRFDRRSRETTIL
jgi:hypothetical protein